MSGEPEIQRLFVAALVLTVGIETVVLFLVVRFGFKLSRQTHSNSLLLFSGCCASAGTLPYLWFVLPSFLRSYAALVVVGELLVFLVEAVFYRFVLALDWSRCLLLSLLCNAGSAGAGLFLSLK